MIDYIRRVEKHLPEVWEMLFLKNITFEIK